MTTNVPIFAPEKVTFVAQIYINMFVKHINSLLKMAKSKFREIYDSLPTRAGKAPKTLWVEHIAEICMVNVQTVRCWVYGAQKPDALRTSIIAKELGVPADQLFV